MDHVAEEIAVALDRLGLGRDPDAGLLHALTGPGQRRQVHQMLREHRWIGVAVVGAVPDLEPHGPGSARPGW